MIHSVILPLLILFAPWLAVRFVFTTGRSKQITYRQSAPYLWAAALVWEIGILVPDVPISPETETFGVHTMGGVAAGILFYFVIKAYGLRFSGWWQKPLALYFLVCGLGIANELLEFFTDKTGLVVVPVHRNDTWWDMVANTLGAAIAFITAELYIRLRRQ